MNVPVLVILMGLPGSGKSYVASHLEQIYNFTVLSGEEITTQLFGTEKVSGDQYFQAYNYLRSEAVKLISQGKSVVIDGTNLKHSFRQQIYDEVKCDKLVLIYLKTDDKTALDRISKRQNSCSPETYEKFKSQIEEPSVDENVFVLTSDDQLLNNVDSLIAIT